MCTEINESIKKTKSGFEKLFETGTYYNKQTQDREHLELILNSLPINDGMRILDLGTGMGYLSFPIAKQHPNVEIIGLDIVEQALVRNREKVEEEGLKNLQFVNYNGVDFPFENETFDMVITRYALHHFPAINNTFKEISRVLKPNGIFFLSDPAPNEDDTERFVDAYMQTTKDGHIKFYSKQEWQTIGKSANLTLVNGFETSIRFPKRKKAALGLEDVLDRFDPEVIKGYDLQIVEDEVWVTERVNNLTFQKL